VVYDYVLESRTDNGFSTQGYSAKGKIEQNDPGPDFLDLAILYALLSFIGTIALLKYVSYGDLSSSEHPEDQEDTWTW